MALVEQKCSKLKLIESEKNSNPLMKSSLVFDLSDKALIEDLILEKVKIILIRL